MVITNFSDTSKFLIDTSVLQMQKGKANENYGNGLSELKKENVFGDKCV